MEVEFCKDISRRGELLMQNFTKTYPQISVVELEFWEDISPRAELRKRNFTRHSLKVTMLSR